MKDWQNTFQLAIPVNASANC